MTGPVPPGRAADASPPGGGHGLTGIPDAIAFLERLTRLDPAALVRIRSVPAGAGLAGPVPWTLLWARLPWSVLVCRAVAGRGPGDATVAARDLLGGLRRPDDDLPARRDTGWRWPLPPATARAVETIPGADLRRIARAAGDTLRAVTEHGVAGRSVGQRMVRDALLDHVAVVVTAGYPSAAPAVAGAPVEVTQRLVQAVVRMGFLPAGAPADVDAVRVVVAPRWVGLYAPYGIAWALTANQLSVAPVRSHPNG